MSVVEKTQLGKSLHRLTHETPEKVLASLRYYTRFVLFSKMMLGILSLSLIVVVIILPILNADQVDRISFATSQQLKGASVPVMDNPIFQGVDAKNQPYLVTADSALQHDEKTIILTKVQADMMAENETWVSVKAKQGTIDTEAKKMNLKGDVRLLHQDGYEFQTSSADVDMQARIAQGNEPVNGFGPAGVIDAKGFVWQHDSGVLKFVGGVKMKVKAND